MTAEKALELLKDHEYWTTYSWQDEMCEIAIKALEKQIPKKPIKYKYEIVCPSCKTLVGSAPYCRYCGQALEWGDR